MGAASEWNAVAKVIADAPAAWDCPAVARLFQLAEEDGPIALRSFAKELGEDRIRDLVRDLLTQKLVTIVRAVEPRGFFFACIRRRALDWKRRKGSKVVAPPEEADGRDGSTTHHDHAARIDLESRWRLLKPREREILSAIRMGEDRDDVARHWSTTRNNIDKIVSRALRQLAGEDP